MRLCSRRRAELVMACRVGAPARPASATAAGERPCHVLAMWAGCRNAAEREPLLLPKSMEGDACFAQTMVPAVVLISISTKFGLAAKCPVPGGPQQQCLQGHQKARAGKKGQKGGSRSAGRYSKPCTSPGQGSQESHRSQGGSSDCPFLLRVQSTVVASPTRLVMRPMSIAMTLPPGHVTAHKLQSTPSLFMWCAAGAGESSTKAAKTGCSRVSMYTITGEHIAARHPLS